MPGRDLLAQPATAGRNLLAPAPRSADQLRAQNPAEYDPSSDAYQAKYGSEDAGINPLNWGAFKRRVKGKGEALLNLGTGMLGGLGGGLTYLGTLAGTGGDTEAAKAVQEATQDKLTYPPKTDEGKRFATETANTMALLGPKEGEWAGEKTAELTGSPTLGAAVNTGVNALPMMVGVRRPLAGGASELGRIGRAPTRAELGAQAHATYQTAENTAGIVPNRAQVAAPTFDFGSLVKGENPYTPAETTTGSTLQSLAKSVTQTLAEEKYRPKAHPKTADQLDLLQGEITRPEVGQSFGGLESIRKGLADSAWDAEPESSDARLANKVLDHFDDWADGLKPEDMVGGAGDPQAAMAAFKEGRASWNKMKKAQTIDIMVEKARNNAGNYSQSGLENALRRQFVQLANNASRMRQFSAGEQAAILRIVRPSLGGRMARGVGKFAIRGPVSGGLDMALGPASGMALAGIGEAGRLAATLRMENQIGALSEMVRGGARPTGATPTTRLNVAPALIPAGQQQ